MSSELFVDDPESVDGLVDVMEEYEEKGAPDPNLFRVLGHHPTIATSFGDHWNETFYDGVVDHQLKELVRVKISKLHGCSYCGTVGSNKARQEGLTDERIQALEDYEDSPLFSNREKTALTFAKRFLTDDHSYDELRAEFTREETIELMWLVGLCDGLGKVVSELGISTCRVPLDDLVE